MMKTQAALIGILILIFMPLHVLCETYVVGPGQAFTTLTELHASVALAPGDVVDGGGNTFADRCVANVSGTSDSVIKYQNFKLVGSGPGIDDFLSIHGQRYLRFENIQFHDANGYLTESNRSRLAYIDKSSHITMSRCKFMLGNGSDAVGILIVGINGCNSDAVEIRNCTFDDSITRENIRVEIFGTGEKFCNQEGTVDHLKVIGCRFDGGTWGLRFYGTIDRLGLNPSWRPEAVIFANNLGLGIKGPLIASSSAGLIHPLIYANVARMLTGSITNAFQLGWISGGNIYQNKVDTVTSTHTDGSGIILDYSWKSDDHISDSVRVHGNIISGCNSQPESNGILVYKGKDNLVYNNIVHTSRNGIHVSCDESPGNKILNNTVYGVTSIGIGLMDPQGKGAPLTIIENNIIHTARTGIGVRNNSVLPMENNNCVFDVDDNDVMLNDHSHVADPRLVNPALDFRLQRSSVCIGTGKPQNDFHTDIAGKNRKLNPWDIGAHAYMPSSLSPPTGLRIELK